MKIFVAYGYNNRDSWIPEMVFPIIKAFGDEIVTGEEAQGEIITEAVIQRIKRSDALIAFLTRRGEAANRQTGKWETHRWVTDELSQALGFKMLAVEVRETDVDPQGGIAGDRQRIEYDETKRDRCLVELVKTIGRWHQGTMIKLTLLPDEFVKEIMPRVLLRDPTVKCTYSLFTDAEGETDEITTPIIPLPGGLGLNARNVPRGAMIRVSISCAGKMWISNYENTSSHTVQMRHFQ